MAEGSAGRPGGRAAGPPGGRAAGPPADRPARSPVERTAEPSIRPDLLRRWREAEALFFGYGLAEPEFYNAALAAVHGLAAGLADIGSEEELEAAYDERDVEWAEERLAALNTVEADWVDVASARDAAFNLRLHDIRSEELTSATAERMAAARAAGETWLRTADGFIAFGGQRTFRRVDIHTRAGVAVFASSSRDWDRGVSWWLEVMAVNPETGAPVRGAKPLEETRTFADRESMEKAFEQAKRKYEKRYERRLASDAARAAASDVKAGRS